MGDPGHTDKSYQLTGLSKCSPTHNMVAGIYQGQTKPELETPDQPFSNLNELPLVSLGKLEIAELLCDRNYHTESMHFYLDSPHFYQY
ncbi:hypothetical protein XELAEV_18030986mg [Xenopus laevis]|uniref:Uncharacterized protein n=1 Tax=Xenopus laevis TaxID=8355 RepID=A0A974HF86_XENLA|nr:hypothetical protein XELAEV_18030986mg [Xenopus laevis]